MNILSTLLVSGVYSQELPVGTDMIAYGDFVNGNGATSVAVCSEGYSIVKCRAESNVPEGIHQTKGALVDAEGACVATDNWNEGWETRAVATCRQGVVTFGVDTRYRGWIDGSITQACPVGTTALSCGCMSPWGFERCLDDHPEPQYNACTGTIEGNGGVIEVICEGEPEQLIYNTGNGELKVYGTFANGNGIQSMAVCPAGYGITECRAEEKGGIQSQTKGSHVDAGTCIAVDNWSENYQTRAVATCKLGVVTFAVNTRGDGWQTGVISQACPAGSTALSCSCYSPWGFAGCGDVHPEADTVGGLSVCTGNLSRGGIIEALCEKVDDDRRLEDASGLLHRLMVPSKAGPML